MESAIIVTQMNIGAMAGTDTIIGTITIGTMIAIESARFFRLSNNFL